MFCDQSNHDVLNAFLNMETFTKLRGNWS